MKSIQYQHYIIVWGEILCAQQQLGVALLINLFLRIQVLPFSLFVRKQKSKN